jgi:hypothetical protein
MTSSNHWKPLPQLANQNAKALIEFQAVADHAHLRLGIEDKSQLPGTMMMKGISARRIWSIPELKLDATSAIS